MPESQPYTLDLNFQGRPHTIASYLLHHPGGGVLLECGPGSTVPALQARLHEHGLTPADITDLFVTHIHLDHAGAAGWLARHGTRVHVHHLGAPHLLAPEKLLASATRIYGEAMDSLWGAFLPVPEAQVFPLHDGDVVEVGGLRFTALETPGHATHHLAYVFEDICFMGDVGGVRVPGPRLVRLPMPPPEFHLEHWRASAQRLRTLAIRRLAPTHFGIHADPAWHLAALAQALDETEAWLEVVMPANPPLEELRTRIVAWVAERARAAGLPEELIETYEVANPTWMSAAGVQRYWKKYRASPPP